MMRSFIVILALIAVAYSQDCNSTDITSCSACTSSTGECMWCPQSLTCVPYGSTCGSGSTIYSWSSCCESQDDSDFCEIYSDECKWCSGQCLDIGSQQTECGMESSMLAPVWVIVFSVIGGILLCSLCMGIVIFCACRRRHAAVPQGAIIYQQVLPQGTSPHGTQVYAPGTTIYYTNPNTPLLQQGQPQAYYVQPQHQQPQQYPQAIPNAYQPPNQMYHTPTGTSPSPPSFPPPANTTSMPQAPSYKPPQQTGSINQ